MKNNEHIFYLLAAMLFAFSRFLLPIFVPWFRVIIAVTRPSLHALFYLTNLSCGVAYFYHFQNTYGLNVAQISHAPIFLGTLTLSALFTCLTLFADNSRRQIMQSSSSFLIALAFLIFGLLKTTNQNQGLFILLIGLYCMTTLGLLYSRHSIRLSRKFYWAMFYFALVGWIAVDVMITLPQETWQRGAFAALNNSFIFVFMIGAALYVYSVRDLFKRLRFGFNPMLIGIAKATKLRKSNIVFWSGFALSMLTLAILRF